MRTLSSQEAQVAKAPGYAARLRVRVADGGGTLRDLTSLDLAGGRDFTRSIRVVRHIDQDFATANFTLRRQLDRWNLSPLVDSKLNVVSGSYSPLLARGRLCVVEAYLLPSEMAPSSGDWREVFRGTVGTVDEAQDTLEVQVQDQWHTLADATHFLETERQYGSGGGVAVQTVMQQLINDSYGQRFVASGAYTNRDRVIPTTPAGFWYRSESTASAGAEPTWPTTVGNTVTSGSVTFRCMGTILQLYTPVSPAWNIAPAYQQKRVSCWQAIRALVNQLGWQLLDRYDSGASAWKLTLIEPDRTKTSPDFTWYPDTTDSTGAAVPSILEIPSWRTGAEDVRNVIDLTYPDPADLDPAGKPKRKTVRSRDTTSIDANEWRWMGLAEQAASQITTSTEGQRMVDALKADMKDPLATHDVVCPLFWAAELGDLYRFKGNGYSYTADQDLAVAAIQHEQGESGAATTRLTCRGKPSAGFERWRSLGYDVSALRPATYNGPDQATGVTVTKVQGGLSITWAKPTSGPAVLEYEVHASTSSGFTPSSSTLKAVTAATNKTLGDLTPGATYYVVVVPRGLLGERGAASAQASSSAGYTPPRAMDPQTVYERLPFNPDFESFTVGTSAPPDSWTDNGTWGVSLTAETSNVQSGSKSVYFHQTGPFDTHPLLKSELFPAVAGDVWELSIWAKTAASPNGGGTFDIRFFSDLGVTSLGTISGTIGTSTSWARFVTSGIAPASTRYARIELYTGTNLEFYADNVTAVGMGPDWVAPSSFGTSWGNGSVGYALKAMRDRTGRVWLRGTGSRSAGTAGTVCTWPAGLRPGATQYFVAVDTTGASLYFSIATTGVMTLVSAATNGRDYDFSMISFQGVN